MTSAEIRKRFLGFFQKRGHVIIPSASLVPENDPTTLFNTAGMQPLVPYLMGRKHPSGDKLANVQKCVRTWDIDEIGDNTHLTFFEMMGNWSLGDYFKKDAIKWSYELLTDKKEGFGLDPKRLYVTVFIGNENAPRDEESALIWQSVGIPKNRIYYKDASANWWPAIKGTYTWTGPAGPCSEMFYDITANSLGDLTAEEFAKADEEQKVVEIWNDVFMEYEMRDGRIIGKLKQKNVDTGAGLERLCAVLQDKSNVFETDLFVSLIKVASGLAEDVRRQRTIADHVRTATFAIADGVRPANTDQGYILRRVIRRMVFNTDSQKLERRSVENLVSVIVEKFGAIYPNISFQKEIIINEIAKEADKFSKAISQGLKEFEKVAKNGNISGADAFKLFSSYGLPIDMTVELAKIKKLSVNQTGFNEEFEKHQKLSRVGAEKKFKGGLGDTSEMSVKYHTATHLLHQALRDVLGVHVTQKGSNITPERLRFDFTHNAKMTDEEKKRVEDIVNTKIKASLPVHKIELSKAEAEKTGALHFFGEKYGDVISIYYIGDSLDKAYSKEFCGGPHVENTGILGTFKIQKEEAVSAGVRRIKAILK